MPPSRKLTGQASPGRTVCAPGTMAQLLYRKPILKIGRNSDVPTVQTNCEFLSPRCRDRDLEHRVCRIRPRYPDRSQPTDTHPRNCLRVVDFVSPCEYKATTDRVAQFSIEFGMSLYLIDGSNRQNVIIRIHEIVCDTLLKCGGEPLKRQGRQGKEEQGRKR